MPRRKQSNPQPVKLEYEDGITVGNPDTLVLESNLLLGQDLEFGEADFKIIGFDRDSDCVSGDMGMAVYSLSDEDCGSYKQLSLGSDVDELRDPTSDHTFRPHLSCRGCGEALDEPDQPLCLHCGVLAHSGTGRRSAGGIAQVTNAQNEGRLRTRRRNKPAKTASAGTAASAHAAGTSRKSFACQLCAFTSRYSNHLKRHMKTHNGEKPYQCPRCPYASAQLVNLQRHTRTHTGEKPYKCAQCAFACSSLGNLRRHQRLHAEERPHTCGQCSYRAGSSVSLKRHMATHKGSGSGEETTEDGVMSDFMLSISSSDADFLHSYEGLQEDQPPPSLLEPGAEEGGGGEEEEEVASVLLEWRPSCELDPGQPLPLAAPPCASSAKHPLEEPPQQTPEPPAAAQPERLYTCPVCPFSSHYPNHLARHRKTHSGEKPYGCPHCPYASAHLDNLKRHLRVHTGEKPYACARCDYACGNLANLRRHERIHTGAKPFQCPLCPYSCNQSMNLKRHMLRHNGHKPHRCPLCNYTTGHWDNYKRHQKKHSGGMTMPQGWPQSHPEQQQEMEEEEEEEV
ncbi:LOW QUALITY PROTEIN: zinc finger protein 513 [Alosa alosa]|uniref:LOW QUALITY PROTEIN: zinc finger protein 513 n=1 Tax=Alosa alosa TaxID=278164 RepID=UPI00201508D8|nr:LOW QUALITY PROTEIN: zinc finger protein 513 [Alosa alosa]